MDVRAGTSEDGAPEDGTLERARARWRATGERVWSIAVIDGEGYRRLAEQVGAVLDEVRERTPTLGSLLALDADPAPVLDRVPDVGSSGIAGRAVLEAACAIRADELVAARARDRRIAAIDAARAAGERWVVLDDRGGASPRSVAMHLATGRALVATADPFAGPEPYAVGEAVLDVRTGDPLTGHGDRDASFADREAWMRERARRRAEIDSRLDGDDPMLSDKRWT
jgi:hypothetical protein